MRLTGLILGIALAAAVPTAAHAERVDVPLRTGSAATGEISAPGEVSTAAFLLREGTKRKLSITVKKAKRSSLKPVVRVFAPDGSEVDFTALGGKVKAKATNTKIKLRDVPETGLWRIEVTGAEDTTGAYQIIVKAGEGERVKGSTVIPLGNAASVPVNAGDGYAVTIATKRSKGSSVVPDFELIDPNGNVIGSSVGAAKQNTKKGTAKLKKFDLPTFGSYVVRFVGDQGTGGGISYSIKTSRSKYKGTRATADPGAAFAVEPVIPAVLDSNASVPSSPGLVLTPVWTQVAGPEVTLSDPASARPAFEAPAAPASLAFQLAVSENGVFSEPRIVVVDVSDRPIADPGRSRSAAPGSVVALDARASFDRNERGLAFAWRVIEGDVILDDATSAAPSFTAPATDGIVRLGLIADDGVARSFEATQTIVISTTPTVVADAGREQFVGRMASVHLSGLASERPSGVLDAGAEWTQLGGPTVELSGADTYHPSFTAPRQAADLMFELRVDGDETARATTWVRVRPNESNAPPATTANGPLVALTGSASLDAGGSFDVNGDDVAFRWATVDGGGATINDVTGESATAMGLGDTTGRWIFALQTRDDLQYGAPEVVRAIGPAYAGTPLAFAGPNRSVAATTVVGLDGSQSMSTGAGDLTFTWRQVSGTDWYDVAGEDPSFDATADRPQFRLPADLSSLTSRRSLTFELTVTDGNGTSEPDLVTLTFTGLPLNSAPVVTASASSDNPLAGEIVTLNGTATDRDGDDVTVEWRRISGPLVDLSPGNDVLSPSFVAPAAGTVVFDLVGNDGFVDGIAQRVTIVIDEKPTAVATVDPPDGPAGTNVTFDASGSSDPEGEDLTYTWTQIQGTDVSFDAGAASFQVASPENGVTFRLVVNDGRQDSEPVQVAFSDETAPTPAPTADKVTAAYGASVQLRANPSDADPATFVWRQINSGSDPSVSLSSTTAENPSFSVPLPSSSPFGSAPQATFGVIASRNGKSSEEKTVVVTFFASYNDSSLSSSDRVYGIISQSCTGCHRNSNNSCPVGSGGNATGYGMGNANAFSSNSINANSCNSGKQRVVPNNAGASYLMDRLNGSGGAMPPSGVLSAARRNLIRDWIDQGANTSR